MQIRQNKPQLNNTSYRNDDLCFLRIKNVLKEFSLHMTENHSLAVVLNRGEEVHF